MFCTPAYPCTYILPALPSFPPSSCPCPVRQRFRKFCVVHCYIHLRMPGSRPHVLPCVCVCARATVCLLLFLFVAVINIVDPVVYHAADEWIIKKLPQKERQEFKASKIACSKILVMHIRARAHTHTRVRAHTCIVDRS